VVYVCYILGAAVYMDKYKEKGAVYYNTSESFIRSLFFFSFFFSEILSKAASVASYSGTTRTLGVEEKL
jgi:hypothetical protein